MSSNTKTRRLRIDANAIMGLIKGQAGSLQKAMLEAATNSLDAKASQLDITVSETQVILKDDGVGIQSIYEIENYFETFGFNHEGLDRTVGFFGVGRGQLFCFGVNTWRTSEFKMTIDVKKDGLDYHLTTNMPVEKGMTITIDLYQPLSKIDIYNLKNDFRKLVEFFMIPIVFNGDTLSVHPDTKTWDYEDEMCYIKVRGDGRLIDMYSQGHFIQSVYSHRYGIGGTVISKKGFPIKQNLARNDILVNECNTWKNIEKTIRKLAKPFQEKADNNTNMTPQERQNACLRACSVDGAKVLLNSKLFTTSNGKHINAKKAFQSNYLTSCARRDVRSDKLMQMGIAIVLSDETLDNFGVASVQELKTKLLEVIEYQTEESKKQRDYSQYELARLSAIISNTTITDNVDEIPAELNLEKEIIKNKDLTYNEKVAISALRRQNKAIAYKIKSQTYDGEEYAWSHIQSLPNKGAREILFFMPLDKDCSTLAMTDGIANIYLNIQYVRKNMALGMIGFNNLVHLILHEYLHDNSSIESHVHDEHFFEAFHDITMSGALQSNVEAALGYYVKHAKDLKKSIINTLENSTWIVEDIGLGVMEDDEVNDLNDPAFNQPIKVKAKRERKKASTNKELPAALAATKTVKTTKKARKPKNETV